MRMKMALMLALSLAMIAKSNAACRLSTQVVLDGMKLNAGFDLNGLRHGVTQPFHTQDDDGNDYYWNTCGAFSTNSLQCQGGLPEQAGVILRTSNDQTCYVLAEANSMDIKGDNTNLLSSTDPVKGLSVEASPKADCPFAAGQKATVKIQYVCNPYSNEATTTARQTGMCTYEIEVKTPAACPIECRSQATSGTEQPCAKHGICAIDKVASAVGCLCNNGFKGDLCSEKAPARSGSKSTTPLLAGFAITLIILLVILAVGIIRLLRRLSMGDSHYKRMAPPSAGAPPVISSSMGAGNIQQDEAETSLPHVPFPDATDLPERPSAARTSTTL